MARYLRDTIGSAFHVARNKAMREWLAQPKRSRNDLMKRAAAVEEAVYAAVCPFPNMRNPSAGMLRNWGYNVSLGGAAPIPDAFLLNVFVYAEDSDIKIRVTFRRPGCESCEKVF